MRGLGSRVGDGTRELDKKIGASGQVGSVGEATVAYRSGIPKFPECGNESVESHPIWKIFLIPSRHASLKMSFALHSELPGAWVSVRKGVRFPQMLLETSRELLQAGQRCLYSNGPQE